MAWIYAVAALAGAALSSQATRSAAGTTAGAANNANAAQLAMYNQTRQDQTPYREVGLSALANLAGGGGLQLPSQYSANPYVADKSTMNLVQTGPDGLPAPNPLLYARDQNYRRAWDNVAAWHQATYNQGFAPDTQPIVLAERIRAELPDAPPAAQAGQPLPQGQADDASSVGKGGANSGGMLGSLTRPFGVQDAQTDFASQMGLTRRFTTEDLQNDPVYQASYQAGLDMGSKKIEEQMRAAGLSNSGGAVKALARYAGDYTSQRAGDAFNRFQAEQGNTYNRLNDAFNRYNVSQGNQRNFLSSLAGIGQQATNQVGAAGTNFANNASNIAMQAGQNAGAAQIAQGNIWGGAAQGIGNWWTNQNTLDRLLAGRNSGGGYSTPAAGVDPNVYYSGNGQTYG